MREKKTELWRPTRKGTCRERRPLVVKNRRSWEMTEDQRLAVCQGIQNEIWDGTLTASLELDSRRYSHKTSGCNGTKTRNEHLRCPSGPTHIFSDHSSALVFAAMPREEGGLPADQSPPAISIATRTSHTHFRLGYLVQRWTLEPTALAHTHQLGVFLQYILQRFDKPFEFYARTIQSQHVPVQAPNIALRLDSTHTRADEPYLHHHPARA